MSFSAQLSMVLGQTARSMTNRKAEQIFEFMQERFNALAMQLLPTAAALINRNEPPQGFYTNTGGYRLFEREYSDRWDEKKRKHLKGHVASYSAWQGFRTAGRPGGNEQTSGNRRPGGNGKLSGAPLNKALLSHKPSVAQLTALLGAPRMSGSAGKKLGAGGVLRKGYSVNSQGRPIKSLKDQQVRVRWAEAVRQDLAKIVASGGGKSAEGIVRTPTGRFYDPTTKGTYSPEAALYKGLVSIPFNISLFSKLVGTRWLGTMAKQAVATGVITEANGVARKLVHGAKYGHHLLEYAVMDLFKQLNEELRKEGLIA